MLFTNSESLIVCTNELLVPEAGENLQAAVMKLL